MKFNSSNALSFCFYFLQGQCLISIGGDAVYVSYYADD